MNKLIADGAIIYLPVLTIYRSDLVVDVSPYDCSPSLETK